QPGYWPHVLDVPRVRETIAALDTPAAPGFERVAEAIGKAWQSGVKRSGGEPLADDGALKVGRGYLRNVLKLDRYTDLDSARFFSGNHTDLLRQILTEEGVAPDVVEKVLYDFKPDAESGLMARARRRLPIDENYRYDLGGGNFM